MPLSAAQQSIILAPQRFIVVVSGRRFGKTHLGIRQLAYHARKPFQTVWAVYPSYRQAKMVGWKKLKQRLLDLRWVAKFNETELTLDLKNGSTISLKGADNYDSLRGVGINFLLLDEFADVNPEAWYSTLRPTLSDTGGGALFLGTPKGLNWAYDLWNLEKEFPDEWRSFQFTTIDGGRVPPEEIEAARRTLDPKSFRQEYLASFETDTGRVYYAFDRKEHIKTFDQTLPYELHWGIDFNISPMSAVLAVRTHQGLHIIDEISVMTSNTDELVREILDRYPKHRHVCYPDPAGSAQKTSAGGKTDHAILRSAGFTVLAPRSHNPVRDGINAVNSLFCSESGLKRLYIAPQCKYLITSLERLVYKEGTSIPQKGGTNDYTHMGDALRYMVDYLFPITNPVHEPEVKLWTHKLGTNDGQQNYTTRRL